MKEMIFGLTAAQIRERLAPLGAPAFRAVQIAEWLYKRGADSFAEMENLPLALRRKLEENFSLMPLKALRRLDSADGKTTKLLLAYPDGVAIETVLMRQSYGNSVCVSTQAGCAMGCVFCASTLGGVTRSLTAAEILAQAVYVNRMLGETGGRVQNIVVMGSGEPLANYEAAVAFIRLCHSEEILNLGYRNITLSTSGIVPMIDRLAEEGLPITLSISLHAPNDDIRSELMPINRKYNIHSLVEAGRRYAERTGRRVTYEYILINGKNDATRCAESLARLLRGQLANVNLIPINPVAERGLLRPAPERVAAFAQMLERRGVTATVRREMGADIQAACGQLRNRHLTENTAKT